MNRFSGWSAEYPNLEGQRVVTKAWRAQDDVVFGAGIGVGSADCLAMAYKSDGGATSSTAAAN